MARVSGSVTLADVDTGGSRRTPLLGAGYALVVGAAWLLAPPARIAHLGQPWLGLTAPLAVGAVLAVLTYRRYPAVLVPGLILLILIGLTLDAGVVTIILLCELLFAASLHADGLWRLTAWAFALAVNVALALPAFQRGGISPSGAALILQNLTLSVVAVWWGQNIRLLNERSERERSQIVARELAAFQARELAELQSELAVSAERSRLARDIHDLVAGRLAAVSLQAAMAQDVQNNGVEVASYVDAIRRCSDGTLREVRDMIVHLARDTVTDSAASSRRRFMEAVEIAQGLGVNLLVEDALTGEQDAGTATLYFVAQEAVVNMVVHASPCQGKVRLTCTDHHFSVEATNALTRAARRRLDLPGSGQGLRNMTRRLSPLGGTLDYGKQDQGRTWFVHAEVPRPPR